jgi:hypothetical protein
MSRPPERTELGGRVPTAAPASHPSLVHHCSRAARAPAAAGLHPLRRVGRYPAHLDRHLAGGSPRRLRGIRGRTSPFLDVRSRPEARSSRTPWSRCRPRIPPRFAANVAPSAATRGYGQRLALPDEVETIAEVLQRAGYFHHGGRRRCHTSESLPLRPGLPALRRSLGRDGAVEQQAREVGRRRQPRMSSGCSTRMSGSAGGSRSSSSSTTSTSHRPYRAAQGIRHPAAGAGASVAALGLFHGCPA